MDYKVTDRDFERCIGYWLNSNNKNYQQYVQGIKLFKEYLDEQRSLGADNAPTYHATEKIRAKEGK